MEKTYYPETLYELDPGPWKKDPESHVWATEDGRVAVPAWQGLCISWNRWSNERVETTQKRTAKFCTVGQNTKDKLYLRCAGGFVHQVVARAWIPNPENKPQVHHRDHNPKNNRVDNLEWVTNSENIQAAYDFGLMQDRKRDQTTGRFV